MWRLQDRHYLAMLTNGQMVVWAVCVLEVWLDMAYNLHRHHPHLEHGQDITTTTMLVNDANNCRLTLPAHSPSSLIFTLFITLMFTLVTVSVGLPTN